MESNGYYMGQSFIVVRYGDNQEALFNPWCTSTTLIEWIRKKCDCADNDVIDLLDLDGQVKFLSAKEKEYACDVVDGRQTYILIRIEKQGENEPSKYISLLNNLDKLNPDLMVKLNDLSKPSKGRKDRRKNMKSNKGRDSPSKRPASSDRKNRTK
ncbi:uncharacterized protein C22orf15-like [Liolophura sinensis]|uniref:uncharacterized protein C22orf15-like n=1 Tax=Liolophura sinensis TaxID=3198878 RepID=UPI003157FBA2